MPLAATDFVSGKADRVSIIVDGKLTMNGATVTADYFQNTEVDSHAGGPESLDAARGILMGVLAGGAAWLGVIVVVLSLC